MFTYKDSYKLTELLKKYIENLRKLEYSNDEIFLKLLKEIKYLIKEE